MYSNFANISFLIDNMANPLNLSCEVLGKRISLGVRQKEPLMLIDYQEMLLERGKVYVVWWWLVARMIFWKRERHLVERLKKKKMVMKDFFKWDTKKVANGSLQFLARHYCFQKKKK